MWDRVLSWARGIKATVDPTKKAVLVNVEGMGGDSGNQEPLFGQLGVVAVPRPAVDDKDATGLNPAGYPEYICGKPGDGLQPVAHRDLRLNEKVNPSEGDINLVQYGGGFVNLKDASDGHGTEVTVFSPQLDSSGAVVKAHALSMNPAAGEESVILCHALGMAVVMTKDGELVFRSDTGAARIILKGDQITFQAKSIIMQGNVVVGANPATAVPLLAGAASPPCPTLYLSPV